MTSTALRLLALLVLLPFTALTVQAGLAGGVTGFPDAITHDLLSLQIWVDLVIAVMFWCGWVVRDARAHGRNGWAWVVSALIVGCFAPLAYMLVHRRWPGSPLSDDAGDPGSPSRRRMIAALVFVPFAALTVAGVVVDGTDVPGTITRTWPNIQIFVDLVLAIGLWVVWMVSDARSAGRNPWGWVVFAAILGSFSPLLYTVVYRRWPASHPASDPIGA